MSAGSVVRTRTTEGLLILDITREVDEAVRASRVRDGICWVYSPHTTSAIRINESEAGFVDDFRSLLMRLVPREPSERVGARDSRARCLSMLLGPSAESVPVSNGELRLGRWQRVLFLELQGEGERERDIPWLVQVVGS